MSQCVMCSKQFDVECGNSYVSVNLDGDFACSTRCADAYYRMIEWIAAMVCRSETLCSSYLEGSLAEPNFYDL